MLELGGIKIKVKGSESTGIDTVTLTDRLRDKNTDWYKRHRESHTQTHSTKRQTDLDTDRLRVRDRSIPAESQTHLWTNTQLAETQTDSTKRQPEVHLPPVDKHIVSRDTDWQHEKTAGGSPTPAVLQSGSNWQTNVCRSLGWAGSS